MLSGSNAKRRLLMLVMIMAIAAATSAAFSVAVLYRTALDGQRARLTELAQSQARLIEAIARYDFGEIQESEVDDAVAATMSRLVDAHERYKGFGETGEFTLARRDGNSIEFLLSHRHFDLDGPRAVPWGAELAEPMRRALRGQSGTLTGLDYRSTEVLAAHEPVAGLDLGIVAKIDMAEIRAPFIRAGLISGFGTLLVFLVGSVLFRHIGAPIIELDRAQEKLRRQAAILNQIQEAMVSTDLDGLITEWNKGAERLWGYRAEQAIGRHHAFLYAVEEEQLPESDLVRILESGEKFEKERRFARKSGEQFDGVLSLSLMRDADGKQVSYVYLVRDVTALNQAEAALRQAQKMEAVGQLTGGVAHDFNNLLMVIEGNLEILSDHLEGDHRLENLVSRALGASHRGAELTHRLLAFSRQQPLCNETTDVNQLIDNMIEMLGRTLGGSYLIETDLEPDLWLVSTDPNQFENALLNLALNARDAMPEGGTLTIQTRNVGVAASCPPRKVGLVGEDTVEILVRDDGEGMPPNVLSQVFEPFFTTKDVGEGSGLGLSMVYGFIKQTGGDIGINSEEGVGTVVEISLPRTMERAATKDTPSKPVLLQSLGDKVILVVEDNPDVRSLTTAMLASLGYNTLEAEDAGTALEILKATPNIGLLFTDVILPGGMSGAELARAAAEFRPDLKVLFASGFTRAALFNRNRLDDGIDLIVKPYQKLELADKLGNVLSANS